MPELAEYENHVRALCVSSEPPGAALAALGGAAFRWLRYRRMVQRRFFDVVEHAFPLLRAAVNEATFTAWVGRFLEHHGPRSPYLRDVPGELIAWTERAEPADLVSLPAYALDLARLEWAELSVTYDEAESPAPRVVPLVMDRPAVLRREVRLLALEHAVHRFDPGGSPPEKSPTHVCVYRSPETHEAHTLELTHSAYCLLALLRARDLSLAGAIERAAADERAPLDRPFLEATSELLADLSSRGLLLGSLDLAEEASDPGTGERNTGGT